MFLGLMSLFIAGLIFPAIANRLGRAAGITAALVAGAAFLSFLKLGSGIPIGGDVVGEWAWIPQLGFSLRLRLDGLALLFGLIITGIGFWVFLYAGAYLSKDPQRGRFMGVMILFMASMLGVVLSDQVLALFVFWELTSFTSYLLIGHYHDQAASRRAALQAMLVTVGGGFFLLVGLLLLGSHYGSYQLSSWITLSREGFALPPASAVLFLLLGAWTKSAHMPFHFWLPNAMQAPSPASAYLHSSTMVKAGVYLIMRMHPALVVHPLWSPLVVGVGALTFGGCAIMAVGQKDLKRLLAYTTASALGSMTMMTGIGSDKAAKAAVLLLAAHALYKASLFLVAGSVDHATGTRDTGLLSGLGPKMPWTRAGALLAALSMAGLPPFFGFIAKETAYAGSTHAFLTLLSVAASAAFVMVAMASGIRPFFGEPGAPPHAPHEASPQMWMGPMILGGLGLIFGLFPSRIHSLISGARLAITPDAKASKLLLWHGLNLELLLSLITLGLGWTLWKNRECLMQLAGSASRIAVPAGPDRLYDLGLDGLMATAKGMTRRIQSGSLRNYILTILAFILLLSMIGFFRFREDFPVFQNSPFTLIDAGLILVILTGALAATTSSSRLTAILSLGVVGYSVALFFILYGAPDLAMTQLIIESLTVILIALAFYHLPAYRPLTQYSEKSRDMIFASLTGLVVGGLTLVANQTEHAPGISSFFMENSLTKAYGKNVVNVILVDFRALDTLGEITVLTVAGLGSYALLKLIPARQKEEDRP